MDNAALINTFYQSFANHDAEGMVACYHDQIEFEDPAFGPLKGDRAKAMWRMLLTGASSKVTFSNVQAEGNKGSADWVAEYTFGPDKRPVVNVIHAEFEFADGKIIRHTDTFDLWKWSGQALGMPGKLLGWSGFMRNKIRQTTHGRLAKFMGKK
ncbi:nuclear transport factor 2 family protein [Neolewinella agarilytica]|uniref:Ketosteroid isomerase-related protein n=1 Tax=Neolewinella agarilytica TaxID=478744 RepID=A0A1H9NS20_9BACT|nr:nuclear transport factor 2 family protein [Neolewinella agarilytica]SER38770.1 Ketosteroid isomerase-related protein [Neolewinella agarilytica]